jgi:hypothetical protein
LKSSILALGTSNSFTYLSSYTALSGLVLIHISSNDLGQKLYLIECISSNIACLMIKCNGKMLFSINKGAVCSRKFTLEMIIFGIICRIASCIPIESAIVLETIYSRPPPYSKQAILVSCRLRPSRRRTAAADLCSSART